MKKTIHIEGKTIRKACLEAGDLFKKWGIWQIDNDDMVLALDESLTNIYEHGYICSDQKKHMVTIEIFRGERKVYIVISDNACHFSFETVDLPDKSEYINSKIIGGFGISIIKKIMSDVCHFQLFDENVLILGKEVRYQNTPDRKSPFGSVKNNTKLSNIFNLI